MAVNENRAFSEMLAAARSRLTGRSPLEIAEKAHVVFDQGQQAFLFSSLGERIVIHDPSYTIEPQLEEWQHLVILHYLEMADGTPLGQRMVSFGELRDGLVWGSGSLSSQSGGEGGYPQKHDRRRLGGLHRSHAHPAFLYDANSRFTLVSGEK